MRMREIMTTLGLEIADSGRRASIGAAPVTTTTTPTTTTEDGKHEEDGETSEAWNEKA